MSHGPCEACEELLQGYLDRELDGCRGRAGRVAPRRLRLLPAPLPLRGVAPPVRADDGASSGCPPA